MLAERWGAFVPGPIKRRLMIVETRIDQELMRFAEGFPPGAVVIDAGAGEGRHREVFSGRRYLAVDLAVGDAAWDYSRLDVRADLAALPFRNGVADGAINIVVLEHCKEPSKVLLEVARTLRPGGRLLLVAPLLWEVHQAPHDYYRYTRHGLTWLLEQAGLEVVRIEPIGGFFTVMARRAINSIQFFQRGARWLLFPFAAAKALLAGLTLPWLDVFDSQRDFTLAYICIAEKR